MPNPALQRMANPLRGLSASERARLCGTAAFKGFDFKADVSPSVQFGSQVAVGRPRMDFIA